jgi:hypothetical protein
MPETHQIYNQQSLRPDNDSANRNPNDDLYITHNHTSSFTERGVAGGGSDERPPTTEVVMID